MRRTQFGYFAHAGRAARLARTLAAWALIALALCCAVEEARGQTAAPSSEPAAVFEDATPANRTSENETSEARALESELAATELAATDDTPPVVIRTTVASAPDNRWITRHLPASLLRRGPLRLPWWQWLGIPALLLVAGLLGSLVSRVTRSVLARIALRTSNSWDETFVSRFQGPLTLAWSIAACFALMSLLGLPTRAENFAERVLRLALFIAFFWCLARIAEVIATQMTRSKWAEQHPSSRSLLPLGGSIAKIAILAIGIVGVFAELGYPVASLIAGLGVGGIAVALAAQKTVENLFGAFSLGVDQPFRAGDFVKVEEVLGTVEAIGLRSTRIRTLDRTLVTIPNGKLAEMRIESFAPRDRIRLACNLALVYDTSARQLRDVLSGLESALREQPKLWQESVTVKLSALTDTALSIEVTAWFETADYAEFQLIRQEVLLGFLQVVDSAGTSFAYPTRSVHILPEEALAALAKRGEAPVEQPLP